MKNFLFILLATSFVENTYSFGIEIDTSQIRDRSIWGTAGEIIQTKHIRTLLPKLGQPVHESITKTAISENEGKYGKTIGEKEVLNGVLFNDDPDGFLLPLDKDYNPKGYSILHEGTRWLATFGKVATRQYYITETKKLKAKIKEINEEYDLGDIAQTALYTTRLTTATAALTLLNTEFRMNPNMLHASHYGNLQFLHSMGTSEDTREEVKRNILDYIEYSWKLASGEISYALQSTLIDDIKNADSSNKELPLMTEVIKKYPKTDLLFHSNGDAMVRKRALGSILHIVQDSYAKGHTVREDWESNNSHLSNSGKIRYFQSYSEQDGGKHGEHDTHDHGVERWQDIPGAMTAYKRSSEIVNFFVLKCSFENKYKIDDKRCPKNGVKSYFSNEVFALAPYLDEENKIIDYLNSLNENDTSVTKSHESLK